MQEWTDENFCERESKCGTEKRVEDLRVGDPVCPDSGIIYHLHFDQQVNEKCSRKI